MKADDYARLARELLAKPPLRSTIFDGVPKEHDGPVDASDVACEIARMLATEAAPLAKARRVHRKEAVGAILKELRQRWLAICDRMSLPEFHPKLFDSLVEALLEEHRAKRDRPLPP